MTAENVVNEIIDENSREEAEFLAAAKAEAEQLRQNTPHQELTKKPAET